MPTYLDPDEYRDMRIDEALEAADQLRKTRAEDGEQS